MADLKISALNALSGSDLVAADVVAVVDDSASETKKITVTDLVGNATTLIADATIPGAKIVFSAGQIAGASIASGGVGTTQLADDSVTAAKLANESTVNLVTTLPGTGDFTGQIALDTDDDKIYIWDGSAWASVKGAGSVNVVNGSTTGVVNITVSTSGDTRTIAATLDNTTDVAQFLAGPTGSAGAVSYRAIAGDDLPTASNSSKGGVVVNGNGLAMSGNTITVNNTVTAETSEHHIVQYDANGLITAGKAIAGADVPVATSSAVGVVRPGTGLGVDATGDLNHSNSVSSGTGTKVTFDAQGHITATSSLSASDVPDLDAAKITTGTFPAARIGSDAVTGAKLADYTVAQISETTPTADFTSQFFFNPITRDLFLWDGNVFQPVGISAGEIILAGTYDASTNLLDSVTADGTAAGYTNGAALPAAATGNNRHYVVVSQSGTGTAPAPTVALEPPDIILSNGTSYVLIETSETITAQIASNVGFTPTGNIAGTNVQAALSEVDSEKLAKAGDTMTGNLNLGEDVVLTFEGATSNDFETTLTVADPTADRTITLPNETGTVITTGTTGGGVTSAMITDGTIVNADISASAEIAVSKLANGTARQLLQTDSGGSGVEFTSNVDIPGTLDVTGATTLDADATINTVTVGLGNSGISTNTAVGNVALSATTTGAYNVAVGASALTSHTTGDYNVAVGRKALEDLTTGDRNTAIGYRALASLTGEGRDATAIGYISLANNVSLYNVNVAVGGGSMYSSTTSDSCVAVGYRALYEATTGDDNVAVGYYAMSKSTTGYANVAVGRYALGSHTGDPNDNSTFTGNSNVAVGQAALDHLTTGSTNVAVGKDAGETLSTGGSNTLIGAYAGELLTTANSNVAVGKDALRSSTDPNHPCVAIGTNALEDLTDEGHGNTAVGTNAMLDATTAKNNVGVGASALENLTSGENNIQIGGNLWTGYPNFAHTYSPVFDVTNEDNRLVLGHTSISNAYVKVAFTVTSDERDKMNFAPVPYGLDFVNKLKPTAFQFKVDRDTETPLGGVRYGFKAQEVLELEGDDPVIIDAEDANHLKYKGEHLVPVLVNAVQELTTMVNELKSELAALKGA